MPLPSKTPSNSPSPTPPSQSPAAPLEKRRNSTRGSSPVLYAKGEAVPQQWDDLDQDGEWDEMALLLNVKASEKVNLEIKWTLQPNLPKFPKRAAAHLGYREDVTSTFHTVTHHQRPEDHLPMRNPNIYQYEGVGWESDKVGFRNYFDLRNGKDIFGKRTKEMVLENVGKDSVDYHELRDWGMDILKVGNSLGAGALAILYEERLHRLSVTETASYTLLANGPVRAIFQLNYTGWEVPFAGYSLGAHPQHNLHLQETIQMWAGQNGYESTVRIDSLPQNALLVTGMVNMKNPGAAAYVDLRGSHYIFSHAQQSENSDFLGMAMVSKEGTYDGYGETRKDAMGGNLIVRTWLMKLKTNPNNEAKFRFYACWEMEDEKYRDETAFKDEVVEQNEKMDAVRVIGR